MLLKVCALLILLLATVVSPYDKNEASTEHRRVKRGFDIWSFFQTIGTMAGIVKEQYNETVATLNQAYDIVADGFSDVSTKNPLPTMETTTGATVDGTTSTTTEKYRISRMELGRILNRNYRGLKKLFRLEWNDAINQSSYNIKDYQREVKNAIASYAVFKNESKTLL